MTTQELHIELEMLLQKVNSHWNQNFLPQEKDIFINREISKFIKQRLNPLSNSKRQSIFDIMKRVQDLNSLVKTVPLEVVSINEKEDGIHLPFGFLYYISSSVEVTPICIKTLQPIIDKPVYYAKFPNVKNIGDLVTYVITVVVDGVSTVVFDLSTLPDQYLPQDGIDDYKKNFIINNAILEVLRRNLPIGMECRYNTYLEVFEIRSSEPIVLAVTENNIVVPISNSTSLFKGNNQPKSLEAEVRVVDEEFKTVIKRSKLSGTTDESVVGYLRDTILILPKNTSVVYNKVELTYICKPAKVDVLLDFNSELPRIILEEIIANTAQTLKGVISSDTYEKYVAENSLIE